MFLPLIVASGSAVLAYYIMQARMEVALAKERESLAEARALIQTHKVTMEERIKATEEATRRATMEELMQEIRVEERSYVRDSNTPQGSRRSMIMQERVFFRNLPVSNWTEREMVIEEAPMNGLSPRTENLESPVLAAAASQMMATQQILAMQNMVSQDQTPHSVMTAQMPTVMAPPARMPISKVLEPIAPVPAAAPARRESRTLTVVHAAFGAQ
ncbi:MAG: hypothetical protein WDO18_00415 [Acidobacteriota bacterium]